MSEAALELQEQNNQEAASQEHTLADKFKEISDAAGKELRFHLDQGIVHFNAWLNRPVSRDTNDQLPESDDHRSTEEKNQDHADLYGN